MFLFYCFDFSRLIFYGEPLQFGARVKLQKGMWNGFDFYFCLDRIYMIYRYFFSPAARGLSAEGRIILTILLILSNYLL